MMSDARRRQFLRSCLVGAAWLAAAGCSEGPAASGAADVPAGKPEDERLGLVPFAEEGEIPTNRPFGYGLDGRLFTDLSTLTPETLVTPTEQFFIRTRCSDLLDLESPWKIQVGGLVKKAREVPLESLQPLVKPAGIHVMECSGNAAGGRFGMLGAVAWAGMPVAQVLSMVEPLPTGKRVLVSGFDDYSRPSRHNSVAGASWIFTPEQLRSTGAFLATRMNGKPLTPDHGAPVRLVVPGWYGCTCIKWVDRIDFVDDGAAATSQMREFAARTGQKGVPELAREYRSAAMEQAAMAVGVEKRRMGGKDLYRVAGITWGGRCVTKGLELRFRPDEEYRPVTVSPPAKENPTWAMWSYDWLPESPGRYAIQLRISDRAVPQRRLDQGFYTRYVNL